MNKFEDLCKEHYAKIYNYVLAKTANREAAEDITQEVFFIACRSGTDFLQHEKPLAFLYVTAKNLAFEYFRQLKKVTPYKQSETADGNTDIFEQLCKEKTETIDEDLYKEQVLQALSPSEQRLYQKYYIDKMSMSEIAREFGMKETAIRMKYVRIRKKVRNTIAGLGLDDF